VLIGALLFGYFSRDADAQQAHRVLTGLGIAATVLAVIMLMYLVLGCLMDSLAMIFLRVRIIFR